MNAKQQPKSKIYSLRLRPREVEMVESLRVSERIGEQRSSDFFRMLLHREWNRRRGLAKVKLSDYQGLFRVKGTLSRKKGGA